ncbi:hypothetical protein KM799_07310 [Clostridium tyrobutyricum]|uniref:hypothetical protein n=1 Tax=Clostridium tyrobutyricum TaxID=1519 RepID=UPI001C38617E|nr:hypothetical protein [Clostridium tyrobutyricum]MBV4446410.1 hypothetical protein [Clostridium tyrobutyricum]
MDDYDIVDIFSSIIYSWYLENGRKLNWRETDNPYFILMAEMMLTRTRAEHVNRVYKKFITTYSNIKLLSKANIKELEEILRPLGLKSRCKMLIKAANFIIDKYNGVIPQDKDELLSIPGVGNYVAGMVMNCAFHKREYVVDTNIIRIFNRLLNLNINTDNIKDKEIIKYSSVYFDTENSREYAYAILDFGSAICKSIKPLCNICIVNRYRLCEFSIRDNKE